MKRNLPPILGPVSQWGVASATDAITLALMAIGVYVGEASEAVIYNSHLHHNVIGAESKDGSVAHIINSTLIENKRQINACKKNWHYGSGGRVVVDKSVF